MMNNNKLRAMIAAPPHQLGLLLLLILVQLCCQPGGVRAARDSAKYLVYGEGPERLKQLTDFMLRKYGWAGQNLDPGRRDKVLNPELVIRPNAFKSVHDFNLASLVAARAGHHPGKGGRAGLRSFIVSMCALVGSTPVSPDLHFKQFYPAFDNMKKIREMLDARVSEKGKQQLTADEVPTFPGETGWGLLYSNGLVMEESLRENAPSNADYELALKRITEVTAFLLHVLNWTKAGTGGQQQQQQQNPRFYHPLINWFKRKPEGIFQHPEEVDRLVREEVAREEKVDRRFSEELENIYKVVSEKYRSKLQTDRGNKVYLKEKMEKFLIQLYLVVRHSWLSDGTRVKNFESIYENIQKVEKSVQNDGSGKGPVTEEELTQAEKSLKEYFVAESGKYKSEKGEKALEYCIYTHSPTDPLNHDHFWWGWVYACDDLLKQAIDDAKKAPKHEMARGGQE